MSAAQPLQFIIKKIYGQWSHLNVNRFYFPARTGYGARQSLCVRVFVDALKLVWQKWKLECTHFMCKKNNWCLRHDCMNQFNVKFARPEICDRIEMLPDTPLENDHDELVSSTSLFSGRPMDTWTPGHLDSSNGIGGFSWTMWNAQNCVGGSCSMSLVVTEFKYINSIHLYSYKLQLTCHECRAYRVNFPTLCTPIRWPMCMYIKIIIIIS